jgi:tRNA/rRNA methyltransferase
MDITFILVQPKTEGNIGASARAIKTMGFGALRLVNPRARQWRNEVSRAHGSREILDDAELFESTADAISDLDFVVGTTARRRGFQYDYVSSRELRDFLSSKGTGINRIGILFGTEPEGLGNEDLTLCDAVSSIPMTCPQPSLNLSQAVMIYAYELSAGGSLQPTGAQRMDQQEVPAAGSYKSLKEAVSHLLSDVGIREETVLHRKALEKLGRLTQSDLDLAFYIQAKLRSALPQAPEVHNP